MRKRETTPDGAASEIDVATNDLDQGFPATAAEPPDREHPDDKSQWQSEIPKRPDPMPPAEEVQLDEGIELAQFLFSGTDGHVAVSRRPGSRLLTDFFSVERISEAVESAASYANFADVWIRTSTVRSPLGGRKRGGANDTLHLPFLHLDIDGAWGSHAAADPSMYPPTVEDALSLLRDFPHPSATVLSGGGLYPVWKLREPIEGNDAAAPILRRWHAHWSARAAQREWHLDNTADSSRIIRWPGTMNRKTDPPVPVQLLEMSGEVHDF